MTTQKSTISKTKSVIRKVDWTETSLKFATIIGTAFISSIASAAATDMYHSRKMRNLRADSDSNVLIMKDTKAV